MDSAGRYATTSRLFIDLRGDPSFSEIVRRSLAAGLVTQQSGAHNVGEHVMLNARESLRIGARFATAVDFNYHDYLTDVADGSLPEVGSQPLLRQTEDTARTESASVDLTPIGELLRIAIRAPRWLLPAGAARDPYRQLMGVLEAVVAGPDRRVSVLSKMVDLPKAWAAPSWHSVRQSWINLEDVADLLRRYAAVDEAAVFAGVPSEGADPRLCAYLTSHCRDLTPPQLGEHMRDVMSFYPSTMVPGRCVVGGHSPTDVADWEAWRAMPTVRVGTGVPQGPAGPGDPREQTVAAAFVACHPQRMLQMSATYAELYGEFLCIPAMLEHLERAGFHGLEHGSFTGMASVRRLASKLHRRQRRLC